MWCAESGGIFGGGAHGEHAGAARTGGQHLLGRAVMSGDRMMQVCGRAARPVRSARRTLGCGRWKLWTLYEAFSGRAPIALQISQGGAG